MTAPSPALNAGLLIDTELTVDGSVIDTDRLVSFDVWNAANRIPRARITLYDGEPQDGKFPFSEGEKLIPGNTIELAAGYAGQTATIFKGVITSHSIAIEPGESARLVLDCADILLKMTLSRNSVISENMSDKDLIAALVGAVAGGALGKNDASGTAHASFVQAHASDWDVMLMRAEANGCVAIVDGGKVDILSPTSETTPVLLLDYGESIETLDLTIDASEQLSDAAIATKAWSYADQALTDVTPTSKDVTVPGNLDSSTLAEVFGVATAAQRTGATIPEAMLTDWATGALIRRKLAQVRGSIRFQGSALAKPGSYVTLAGIGERFNGDAFVGAVHHLIADGNWHTTVDIGMAPQGFARSDSTIADADAAGLAPPLRGLQTGKVVKVAPDPDGQYRVQVKLPLFDDENPIWARLGSFYASSGFGALFVPEVDDEVLLGFMNEDPTNPVILGSVYSSTIKPTYQPDDKNTIKAIVTRSLMEIKFDDEKKILKIATPGGRIVTLDDDSGTLSIVDPNKHSITMTSDSVEIVSAANLTMKSTGNMTIKSGGTLDISATGPATVKAPNISVNADVDLKLASNAMGSLKTAAILEINGALVKIN